ncbi:30S ribosomal protein S7 [Candidatus Margulisiibacteriota bacterium]
MPRKGKIKKRKISADPVYNSVLVQKFISKVMYDGKKSVAENIVYTSLKSAAEKLKGDPQAVFEKVIANIRPVMEVKPRRVGGSTYQVPIEVERDRSTSLSMKWLRDYARLRSGKTMVDKLTAELIDAHNGGGGAMKKREDVHRMAEANKAFAHFRW